MGNNLGICFGGKNIALFSQAFTELSVVFNNTVVNHHDSLICVEVRVRIGRRGRSVRRPASVPDGGGTFGSGAAQRIYQRLHAPSLFDELYVAAVEKGHSGRVIPPVFKGLQARNHHRHTLTLFSYVTDDAAHI